MINIETLHKWWDVFVGADNLVEVRIIGRFQYSGYFKDAETLIKAIEPYAAFDDEQCYFTLNAINDACYGRQQSGKIIKSPKTTTTDNDIVRRKWVLIDFDPRRATGTNASKEEIEFAHKKAQDVFRFLRDKGFPEPIICLSGNGYHLSYKTSLPNTQESTNVVKGFLQALALLFSDSQVDIDEKVFNAARICKLYGTVAKKGANLPERPWRMSEILYVPAEIKETSLESFASIVNLIPKEETHQQMNYNSHNGKFDLDAFLNQHHIAYKKVSIPDGSKYILEHCFFDESHKGKDAVLFQYNSGAIQYVCLHNSCKAKTWRDVRLLFDPHAYDYENKAAQHPLHFFHREPQKPKYEIKEELPELGGKWLSLSDIQKIDLTSIENVKTGFSMLDDAIVGLNMSEVTLLSGSNGSGKSSWLNTLLLNIVQQNYNVALWSGELRADILKAWLQMVAAGKSFLATSQFGNGKYYVPAMVGQKIDEWLDGKFFLYNNEYGTKWQQIFHDMEELLKANVKVFALDNLFSLDIDLFDGDKNNRQKELILQIKDFAKKNQVHIILVAHPRKVMTFLRKNDISGTSDISNAVDNVFIIHRVNQDFIKAGGEYFGRKRIEAYREYGNVIEVAKNRMYGVVDFMVGMHYEPESRRFKNLPDEKKHYAWEGNPKPEQVSISITPPIHSNFPQDEDLAFMPPDGTEAPF